MEVRAIVFSVVLAGLGGVTGNVSCVAAQQAAAQQPASPTRVVGAITAVDGKTITVKTDAGASVSLPVGDGAKISRTAPDAKTLAGATPIQLTDLAIGDRVLIAVHPGPDGSTPTATTIIAVKQADIAQKQHAQQSDWQHRGVGGVVKSVDAAAGVVTIASGARTLSIHTSPKTVVRRYDPASIKFSDAKTSSLDQIHVGDQLQALGNRTGDDVEADEIVAGSFRNIAGTIISADAASGTITVNDLATKKPTVIRVAADSQLHKLSAETAQTLAARFKSGGAGKADSAPATAPPGSGQMGSRGGSNPNGGAGSGGGYGQRSGDLAEMIKHAPAIQIADLHKGDAVMIVATQGASEAATAVSVLAGVEPILTASASQNMFSASWNLGGSASGEGAQ
jgi:hypothetical protein